MSDDEQPVKMENPHCVRCGATEGLGLRYPNPYDDSETKRDPRKRTQCLDRKACFARIGCSAFEPWIP